MKVLVLGALGVLAAGAAGAAGFDCLIEPSQVVEVRSPVDGLVDNIHVQRGDPVRKGQVLVELSSALERATAEAARYRSQMEGQIAQSRNRVDFATRKLARADDLARQNYASAQARDEAEAERRIAESELQAALENRELARHEHRRAMELLSMRTMTSPFNGVVVDRLLNPGDLAESGSGRKAVLKVAQIDPLRVDIVLPAALFGQVRAGMQAGVTPVGQDIPEQRAVVRLVDRVVDAASGTFVVRLDLPNPKQALPGGVRCRAEFEHLKAPESAKRRSGGPARVPRHPAPGSLSPA
jgi:RND family efflux transporter MFP subunit